MCFKALCMRGVGRHFLIKKKKKKKSHSWDLPWRLLGLPLTRCLSHCQSLGVLELTEPCPFIILSSLGVETEMSLFLGSLLCSFVSRKTPVPFDRGQGSPPSRHSLQIDSEHLPSAWNPRGIGLWSILWSCNLRSEMWSLSSLRDTNGDSFTVLIIYKPELTALSVTSIIPVITPIQFCEGRAWILCGFCTNVFLSVGFWFLLFFL